MLGLLCLLGCTEPAPVPAARTVVNSGAGEDAPTPPLTVAESDGSSSPPEYVAGRDLESFIARGELEAAFDLPLSRNDELFLLCEAGWRDFGEHRADAALSRLDAFRRSEIRGAQATTARCIGRLGIILESKGRILEATLAYTRALATHELPEVRERFDATTAELRAQAERVRALSALDDEESRSAIHASTPPGLCNLLVAHALWSDENREHIESARCYTYPTADPRSVIVELSVTEEIAGEVDVASTFLANSVDGRYTIACSIGELVRNGNATLGGHRELARSALADIVHGEPLELSLMFREWEETYNEDDSRERVDRERIVICRTDGGVRCASMTTSERGSDCRGSHCKATSRLSVSVSMRAGEIILSRPRGEVPDEVASWIGRHAAGPFIAAHARCGGMCSPDQCEAPDSVCTCTTTGTQTVCRATQP